LHLQHEGDIALSAGAPPKCGNSDGGSSKRTDVAISDVHWGESIRVVSGDASSNGDGRNTESQSGSLAHQTSADMGGGREGFFKSRKSTVPKTWRQPN
jgi:hypothetical protein